jgi:hypothetical protein
MSHYSESFMIDCERGIIGDCRNGSFEMIQQGVDVFVRKKEFHKVEAILTGSDHIFDKLVQYMVHNKYIAALEYLLSIPSKISHKILYEIVCMDAFYIYDFINKFLTDKHYIQLRARTMRLFYRHKIIDSRYNIIINENFRRVKLAILWLSVGVKITLDMKQIKICIDIMLSNYLASLDDIARILDVNEYAKQHKNAAKAIEEIRQILITKLLPYMPDVLCVIIIGYLY